MLSCAFVTRPYEEGRGRGQKGEEILQNQVMYCINNTEYAVPLFCDRASKGVLKDEVGNRGTWGLEGLK